MQILLIALVQICSISAALLLYMTAMWLNYVDSPMYIGLHPVIAMPLLTVLIVFPYLVRKIYRNN